MIIKENCVILNVKVIGLFRVAHHKLSLAKTRNHVNSLSSQLLISSTFSQDYRKDASKCIKKIIFQEAVFSTIYKSDWWNQINYWLIFNFHILSLMYISLNSRIPIYDYRWKNTSFPNEVSTLLIYIFLITIPPGIQPCIVTLFRTYQTCFGV